MARLRSSAQTLDIAERALSMAAGQVNPALASRLTLSSKLAVAAGELLGEVGFEKLTTNAICARAKLTPPAFYRYFKDKYEILEVLARRLLKRQNDAYSVWLFQGVSLTGSVSAGRSASLNTPGAARPSILVAQLLQGLMRVAREALHARGILVHVNNLENLSDSDATRAGAIFRDLRDPCLLADGYHWVVVGTSDALSAAALSGSARLAFSEKK